MMRMLSSLADGTRSADEVVSLECSIELRHFVPSKSEKRVHFFSAIILK